MTEAIQVDDLIFQVRHSPKRRTIGITIECDGTLVLAAPEDCPPEHLYEVARARTFWVHTKLAERSQLACRHAPKAYVQGEGFYYLGRSYRLRLVESNSDVDQAAPLRLHRGRFQLHEEERDRGRDHFVSWYRAHAISWVERRVETAASRLGVVPGPIRVRDLGHRWGSCSSSGALNFHWRVALLPISALDYVVYHEVTHLVAHRHSRDFWHYLRRGLPDYEKRQEWLAQNGAIYDL